MSGNIVPVKGTTEGLDAKFANNGDKTCPVKDSDNEFTKITHHIAHGTQKNWGRFCRFWSNLNLTNASVAAPAPTPAAKP